MNKDTPFRCLKLPGQDPVYKIWDGRTGEWSRETYVGREGLERGEKDAETLNRLYLNSLREKGEAG